MIIMPQFSVSFICGKLRCNMPSQGPECLFRARVDFFDKNIYNKSK